MGICIWIPCINPSQTSTPWPSETQGHTIIQPIDIPWHPVRGLELLRKHLPYRKSPDNTRFGIWYLKKHYFWNDLDLGGGAGGFANHITKIPTVERADCFVVNGWQSKWLYVLEKKQGKPSWTGSGISTHQIGGHSFQCSSLSVFSGNLHNLDVMEERTQMGKQAKEKDVVRCYLYF